MSKLLWEPAIYEQKAALIRKSVREVAYSPTLLAAAMQSEFETYRADFLTVGLDIYNIEAEACGAAVSSLNDESCPEITQAMWDVEALPAELHMPDFERDGRFSMIVEAGRDVSRRLEGKARVRVGVSGPASTAAKFVGLENLVIALASAEPGGERLLEFCTQMCCQWCRHLAQNGLAVVVFDSAASPPLFSPELFRASVRTRHQRVMDVLKGAGQEDRPLIMGGDTTAVVRDLCEAGAKTVVCDFPAPAATFARAIADKTITVRRNVSPAILASGTDQDLDDAAAKLCADLAFFPRCIAGTGILPYRMDPLRFRAFRERVDRAWQFRSRATSA